MESCCYGNHLQIPQNCQYGTKRCTRLMQMLLDSHFGLTTPIYLPGFHYLNGDRDPAYYKPRLPRKANCQFEEGRYRVHRLSQDTRFQEPLRKQQTSLDANTSLRPSLAREGNSTDQTHLLLTGGGPMVHAANGRKPGQDANITIYETLKNKLSCYFSVELCAIIANNM